MPLHLARVVVVVVVDMEEEEWDKDIIKVALVGSADSKGGGACFVFLLVAPSTISGVSVGL